MTVSEFAVSMYYCDVIKDNVKVIKDGKIIYNDRMEFLRYADDYFPKKMWFTGEKIQEVKMVADGNVRELRFTPDYITEIVI